MGFITHCPTPVEPGGLSNERSISRFMKNWVTVSILAALLAGCAAEDSARKFHTVIRMERTGAELGGSGAQPALITNTGTSGEFDTNKLQGVAAPATGTGAAAIGAATVPATGTVRNAPPGLGVSAPTTVGAPSSAVGGASVGTSVGTGTGAGLSGTSVGTASSVPGIGTATGVGVTSAGTTASGASSLTGTTGTGISGITGAPTVGGTGTSFTPTTGLATFTNSITRQTNSIPGLTNSSSPTP